MREFECSSLFCFPFVSPVEKYPEISHRWLQTNHVNKFSCRAGGPIDDPHNPGALRIPPLSVFLRQRIVEKVVNEGGDEPKHISILEGELLAVTATMSDERLELICYDVLTITESAQSGKF